MSRLLTALLLLSVAAALLGSATPVRAADSARPPAAGASAGVSNLAAPGTALTDAPAESARMRARRMLLQRAKERFDAGRSERPDAREQLEGALDALRLAYQLSPAAWMLFNLAQVQSRLGACQQATELYRSFLATQPAAAARTSAEEALKLLGSCADAGAEPEGEDSLLPGLRRASGLASLSASSAPSPLPAASVEPDADGGPRVWPWVLAGLAATSGVAALASYGEARSAQQDLDRIRIGGPMVAQTQRRGESAQTLARVFSGAAVGFALAAGATFWWPRPTPDAAPAQASLARLSWLPLERGAGAAYSFDF